VTSCKSVDPRVDAYIDVLPDWQQAICREVRDLVHAADREVTETKGLAAEVRGLGLMIGIELVKDRTTKEPTAKEAAATRRLAREAGGLIGVGGQGWQMIQPRLFIGSRRVAASSSETPAKQRRNSLRAKRN
jgi:4-aminobutyrate aminotransferase-like enzyme